MQHNNGKLSFQHPQLFHHYSISFHKLKLWGASVMEDSALQHMKNTSLAGNSIFSIDDKNNNFD